MSSHRQALQLAMAGVQQQALPPALARLASEWGEAETAVQAFYQAAAVLTQAERCARPLRHRKAAAQVPAAAETLKTPDESLALLLRRDFEIPNPFAMLDKARLLLARGEHLPFVLLPAWLDYTLTRPADEQALLMRCTGNRGAWLADLNPEWRLLLNRVADDAHWETGTLVERRSWLIALRQRDPAAARAGLAAVWPTEPPEAREAFIECLADGLSIDDEALLEAARSDKRKEVRRLALDLLAKLPDSAFSRRMLERAAGWLSHVPGGLLRSAKLEVRLPDHYDKAWALDGIPERTTRQQDSIGDKANWLFEVIGHLPLDRLLVRLQLTPASFVKLVAGHEYAAALWAGSVASFDRHPNPQMLGLLLAAPSTILRNQLVRTSLRVAVKGGTLDPWLTPMLTDDFDLPLVLPLLPSLDARWSRELLKRLSKFIEQRRAQHGWWSSLLARFAERAHPSTLPEVLALLDPLGNDAQAEKGVTAAVAIADLRLKLHLYHP